MVIDSELMTQRFVELIRNTVCTLPPDFIKAFKEAYEKETEASVARVHLETCINNAITSKEQSIPLCADTGYPCFYIRTGDIKDLSLVKLQECISKSIEEATISGFIRPTMVDPITRKNPGTNVGFRSPKIIIKVVPDIDYCEITYAPKGGGSELFISSYIRTLLVADGLKGVKKFIFDSLVINGNITGGTCPPNILGVGIGGTADECLSLAKQAACLRKINSRNPDPVISELEVELLELLNSTGIGPLGMGGKTTYLDVHIEYSYTHLAGTPVSLALQCPAARVGALRINSDGSISDVDWPEWFSY